MSAPRVASQSGCSLPALTAEAVQQLDRNLRAQLEGYDRLLACLAHKRDALRIASIDGIQRCGEQERALIAALRELELRRHGQMNPLSTAASHHKGSCALSDIASRCTCKDDADRMLNLASAIRARIERVRRESSIIRAAAEALGRHVAGILQTVTGTFANARVYSRRGRMNVGQSTQIAIDLKS